MFIDLWIVALFSVLYGICAWTSRAAGVKEGELNVLRRLIANDIIKIENDRIVPCERVKNS
jgi:hypothetical protein